jgi:hypothetical protein
MRSQTTAVRRGGRWYFRMRVPPDLRPVIKRKELIRSLGIGDATSACFARLAVAAHDLFAQIRAHPRMTQDEINRLLLEFYRTQLLQQRRRRVGDGPPADEDELERLEMQTFHQHGREITWRDAIRFNKKQKEPLACIDAVTINDKMLTAVRTLLNWCADNNHMARDQFDGVRAKTQPGFRRPHSPFETQDLLMGHKIKGIGGEYGRRQLMERRRKAIARVEYPGLDLSHLCGRGQPAIAQVRPEPAS